MKRGLAASIAAVDVLMSTGIIFNVDKETQMGRRRTGSSPKLYSAPVSLSVIVAFAHYKSVPFETVSIILAAPPLDAGRKNGAIP
jgi:hypothetical protein